MRFGLKEDVISNIISVFEKYSDVNEAIIYGSRARGNFRKGSDIDLSLKGKISNEILSNILSDIDELNTPYLFDISIYEKLTSKELISQIDKYGKLFYNRNYLD